MFIKTPEHQDIEHAINKGTHAIVAAGPGSGKTTTISELIIPTIFKNQLESIIGTIGGAIAFNGKNANALKAAIASPHVECGTVHSTLLKCLKSAVNGLKIEVKGKGGYFKGRYTKPTIDKMQRLAETLFPKKKEDGFSFDLALKLVTLFKANALGITGYPSYTDKGAINKIVLEHNLTGQDTFSSENDENEGLNILEESIEVAIKLMDASIKEYAVANYDDMIYMAVQLNAKLPEWKFLVYDEGQDIKPIELEFIKRMAEKGCQIIVVGDSFQAVNQFTGCMEDSLQSLSEVLNTEKLPLRTSYRASHVAAAYANSIFPNSVIPWSGAKQGSEEHIKFDELNSQVEAMTFTSGVLSRTHKNLIGMALKLLSKKKAFTYKGIADLVTKMERMLWHASKVSKDLETIRKNLTEYQANLEDKYLTAAGAIPRWVTTNGETTDALTLLLAHCQGEGGDMDCCKAYLKTLAESEKLSDGPVLSTIHSAKGMQWENVYLVGALQSTLAKSEAQIFAEKCLEYVAYSRSSDKLIFVEMA